MKSYFGKCKSLSDVEKLYRKLAKENHPDKGGDVEVMKEINCEYRISFASHKRLEEYASGREINEHPRFYTAYGYEGVNYDPFMDIALIAKHIRQYCKAVWSECRFSVRIHRYAGGQSLNVEVTESPWKVYKDVDELDAYELAKYEQSNGCYRFYTPQMNEVLNDVRAFMESYNRSDSDGMIDYFDEYFYGFVQPSYKHRIVDRKPKVCKVAVAA